MIEDGLTPKQQEALQIAGSGARDVLLYGGARSGKTFLTCCMIAYRAAAYPGSRHLIARLRWSHAKGAVWLDTLPAAIKFLGIKDAVKWHEQDHYVTIGESEIWVDGLDDKERVDKILGREYATIFLNEISQMTYPTVSTVMTRLAQKVKDCRNMAFYDCNPPSKFHWSYQQFIQGIHPESGAKLSAENYAVLQMNPCDNLDNIADGYMDILEQLPEDKKRRFLYGEFGEAQGVIFTDWDIVDEIPEEAKRRGKHSCGLDFGFTVDPTAVVELWLYGNDLYIDELLYADGLTNQDLGAILRGMSLPEIYADSAEPKSIAELRQLRVPVRGAKKGPDSVRQGIDWLLGKKLHVTRRSVSVQSELTNYAWKQNRDGRALPQPIDDFDHAIDAVRYGAEPFKRAAMPSGLTAGKMGL